MEARRTGRPFVCAGVLRLKWVDRLSTLRATARQSDAERSCSVTRSAGAHLLLGEGVGDVSREISVAPLARGEPPLDRTRAFQNEELNIRHITLLGLGALFVLLLLPHAAFGQEGVRRVSLAVALEAFAENSLALRLVRGSTRRSRSGATLSTVVRTSTGKTTSSSLNPWNGPAGRPPDTARPPTRSVRARPVSAPTRFNSRSRFARAGRWLGLRRRRNSRFGGPRR